MKHVLKFLFLFCIPLLFMACEEGLLEDISVSRCKAYFETKQEYNTGLTVERVYGESGIIEIQYFENAVFTDFFGFTYGNDGRINKSQYFNRAQNTKELPRLISYNEQGRWLKSTIEHENGKETTISVVYDSQHQIRELTSATNHFGIDSINYTCSYEWEAGNNTVRVFNSPTLSHVTTYEFDLNRENKRRSEQEKLDFLSTRMNHNKHMYRKSTLVVTSDSTSNETVNLYNFQYAEDGYPTKLTLTRTSNSDTPVKEEIQFSFACYLY